MGGTHNLVAGLVRDLGSAPNVLPWATPRVAGTSLAARAQAAVNRARGELCDAWLRPHPHLALVRALAHLDPESRVVTYHPGYGKGPTWYAQNVLTTEPTGEPFRNAALLSSCRLYVVRGRDPYANRPVSLSTLLDRAEKPEAGLQLVESVLAPNDAFHQLRMVIYERAEATLYAGYVRRARQTPFALQHHAMLYALRPALRTWSRIARAIGVTPVGDGALATALSQFSQPAVVLHRGRPVFANNSGKALVSAVALWAQLPVREPRFATSARLATSGLDLELVLPKRGPQEATPTISLRLESLPPRLREIALRLADGLSDKDIANRLDIPVTTVRTYVTRVFQTLGVHSRRELMRDARSREDG